MSKADEIWRKVRVILGIISILLGISIGLYAVLEAFIGAWSLTGGSAWDGVGFLSGVVFFVAGVLAIGLHETSKGQFVCAGVYGLGAIIAAFRYGQYGSWVQDQMLLYGIISLVLAGVFLFSVCRTRKAALISAIVFLMLSCLPMMVIELDKWADREQEQMYAELEEERWQTFLNRTPEEIAQDYLAYYHYSGLSKKELIALLEQQDGIEHGVAEKVADNTHTDWKKQAFAAAADAVIDENQNIINFLDDESIIVGIDKENIGYTLADRGFTEDEIAYALSKLDTEHVREFKKSGYDFKDDEPEVSDLDIFYEYYGDRLSDSAEEQYPDPLDDTSLAFLDVSAGEFTPLLRPYREPESTQFTVEAVSDGPVNIVTIPNNADADVSLSNIRNPETGEYEAVIKVVSANGQKRRNYHIRTVESEDRGNEDESADDTERIPEWLSGTSLSGKELAVTILDIPEDVQVPDGYISSSININGKTVNGWILCGSDSPGHIVVNGVNDRNERYLYVYEFSEKTLQRFFTDDDPAGITTAGAKPSSESEDTSDVEGGTKLYGKGVTVTVLNPEGVRVEGSERIKIIIDGVETGGFVPEGIASPEYLDVCGMDSQGDIYLYCYDLREKTIQKNFADGTPVTLERSWFNTEE